RGDPDIVRRADRVGAERFFETRRCIRAPARAGRCHRSEQNGERETTRRCASAPMVPDEIVHDVSFTSFDLRLSQSLLADRPCADPVIPCQDGRKSLEEAGQLPPRRARRPGVSATLTLCDRPPLPTKGPPAHSAQARPCPT